MGKYRLIAGALVLACAAITSAAADEGPGDCLGVDFDAAHPITIAKISAEKPRTYFLKSAYDDAACPADTDACRQKTYLIPGDLILLGKTFSDKANTPYTCTLMKRPRPKKWLVERLAADRELHKSSAGGSAVTRRLARQLDACRR